MAQVSLWAPCSLVQCRALLGYFLPNKYDYTVNSVLDKHRQSSDSQSCDWLSVLEYWFLQQNSMLWCPCMCAVHTYNRDQQVQQINEIGDILFCPLLITRALSNMPLHLPSTLTPVLLFPKPLAPPPPLPPQQLNPVPIPPHPPTPNPPILPSHIHPFPTPRPCNHPFYPCFILHPTPPTCAPPSKQILPPSSQPIPFPPPPLSAEVVVGLAGVLCASERSRRAAARVGHEEGVQALARHWRHLHRTLTLDRGIWADTTAPHHYHWKLDKAEDHIRRLAGLRSHPALTLTPQAGHSSCAGTMQLLLLLPYARLTWPIRCNMGFFS